VTLCVRWAVLLQGAHPRARGQGNGNKGAADASNAAHTCHNTLVNQPCTAILQPPHAVLIYHIYHTAIITHLDMLA
jgi:hypothetical protein